MNLHGIYMKVRNFRLFRLPASSMFRKFRKNKIRKKIPQEISHQNRFYYSRDCIFSVTDFP